MRYLFLVLIATLALCTPFNGYAQTPAAVWIWNGTLSAPVGTGTTPGGIVAAPMPITGTFTPSSRTIVTLAIKTVTTGGTAVNAIAAGGRTAGGWLQNPPSATINLCINELGVASGTTSSGDTTCITPGTTYGLAPSGNAVSVISSDSSHPFSGIGLQ